MHKYNEELKELALNLFEINSFKFGDYKMKVGINSPVYFDLRVIISYPEIMEKLVTLLIEFMNFKKLNYKSICGVPYTALPIASLISVSEKIPMLIRRKEAKAYGTKKLIEGIYYAGDACLIIEDVVASGSSVLDTVVDLRSEGIVVKDAIVVVDREQGGKDNIEQQGVKMHGLFTLSFLLNTLKEAGKIEDTTVQAVAQYIKQCQMKSDGTFVNSNTKIVNPLSRLTMSFAARADLAKNQVAKNLFKIMSDKKTNLCLAADVTTSETILNLAESVGPYICVLKTHVDIITDYSENFMNSLKSIAKKHNFLIMEDRKFADIGNTVALQYSEGQFKISSWADLVTAHSLPGQGILQGIKSVLPDSENRGVFLLAEMSCQGNLITPQYIESTMKMATTSDVDIVAGIVCQNSSTVSSPGLIQLTPGVRIEEEVDGLGQKYNTPEMIVKENGADIGVVGRGIIKAKDVTIAAKLYRDRLWAAYCDRVGIEQN